MAYVHFTKYRYNKHVKFGSIFVSYPNIGYNQLAFAQKEPEIGQVLETYPNSVQVLVNAIYRFVFRAGRARNLRAEACFAHLACESIRSYFFFRLDQNL
jgi:hypothetical protein